MPIMDDPRVALFFDTTHPLKHADEMEAQIDAMYEPIILPDGTSAIPSTASAGDRALAQLGPSPQQVPVPFPVIGVSSSPLLPYGQRLPAPELPTGPSPVVPSFAQPMVQSLQAPRYVAELPIQGGVRLPSYPVIAAPQGVSTTSPLPFQTVNPTQIRTSGFAPLDAPYTPPGFSTQNPGEWYQDVPAAPGAPATASVNASPAGADTRYTVMQMDNGSIAYVPVSARVDAPPAAGSVRVNAPSTGPDNRYAPALAADGTTVMVATGFPLPAGVTPIPGVTNVDAEGFVQGTGQGLRPGVTTIATQPVVAPVTSGLPGWVLPAAGIGLVLFLLLGRKEK